MLGNNLSIGCLTGVKTKRQEKQKKDANSWFILFAAHEKFISQKFVILYFTHIE